MNQYKAKQLEGANEYQKLLHRVFIENAHGAELLAHWNILLSSTEGFAYGKDLYDLGRMEGRKEFVRELNLLSKQAEER